jgi:hypothetical protein
MGANRFNIAYDYETNANHFLKHNNSPVDVLNTLPHNTHTKWNRMINEYNGAEITEFLEECSMTSCFQQYDQLLPAV